MDHLDDLNVSSVAGEFPNCQKIQRWGFASITLVYSTHWLAWTVIMWTLVFVFGQVKVEGHQSNN